jgi:hypothetical protein
LLVFPQDRVDQIMRDGKAIALVFSDLFFTQCKQGILRRRPGVQRSSD